MNSSNASIQSSNFDSDVHSSDNSALHINHDDAREILRQNVANQNDRQEMMQFYENHGYINESVNNSQSTIYQGIEKNTSYCESCGCNIF